MAFNLKNYLLYSPYFCCCIPVRFGFVIMTCLSFLLSGVLSVLVWFELSHSYSLSSKEKTVFWLVGVVEVILFAVSIVGFIGAVARKPRFVKIYAYFTYIHLLLNIAVGIYFLDTIRQSNRQQIVDECSALLTDKSSQSNCQNLLNISTYVFIAVVTFVLLLELYGALIATRYLNRLTKEKKVEHNHKLGFYHAVSAPEPPRHARDASGMYDDMEMLHPRNSTTASILSYGGVYDYGNDVIDITHQPTTYEPIPTHNPIMLTHTQQSSQSSSTPTHRQQFSQSSTYPASSASSPGFRVLPPRPSSSTVTEISSTHELPEAWEQAPHLTHGSDSPVDFSCEPSTQSDVDHDQRSTHTEISTSAHSALMDHASFMWTRFFPPPSAPPIPELPTISSVSEIAWT
ncbi:hypothetical protein K503DRAFT_708889 [Rhizopogon vinicolor AM-OR11-026]|uniref:Uncharacterized protein n=1 Tax=Rhizopogon vinicolor AM-OR11-026 TaxID=1314800 RepID=A0A1B7NEP5_9AGAM|nr:hypothetical protein K503DRAFT_708889 [Rhizopogon vinicolor AM-OR11-026]